MRFEKTIPAYNTYRTVRAFLWLPLTIDVNNNGARTYGTRWLEKAVWEEKWTKGRARDFWSKMRWIN